MSRLAHKPINLPAGVAVESTDSRVRVVGPRGELTRQFPRQLAVSVVPGAVSVASGSNLTRQTKILLGTYASHLKNMVRGVTDGFSKTLVIEGIGYKAARSGDKLVLQLGLSHPVEIHLPAGAEVKVDKNVITVAGFDKELVGQLAALIRSKKPPEPYKGKGIRYDDEVVRRKAGKKVTA